MTKRPSIDLSALTSEAASPMAEASQRMPSAAPPAPSQETPRLAAVPVRGKGASTPTANLEALAFKVPPAFRRRFRQRAANADLKLNELLFEALDAWEQKRGLE
jgi:hypothetical protein